MIVCRMVFLALVVREFVQKLHTFFYKTCYSGAGTHILQDEAPYDPFFNMLRGALYSPETLQKLYAHREELANVRRVDFYAVAEKAEALLVPWTAQNAFEENCRLAMLAICDMMRASSDVLSFLDASSLYNEAAKRQFEDKAFASAALEEMKALLAKAIASIQKYADSHERAIAKTGHPRADLALLCETVEVLKRMEALISNAGALIDCIPFTRFERLLDRAATGKFIVT